MCCRTLANNKAWLTLSPNDANRHEGTTTTYAVAVTHLPRRYATDAVIDQADEDIPSFVQVPLTRSTSPKSFGT